MIYIKINNIQIQNQWLRLSIHCPMGKINNTLTNIILLNLVFNLLVKSIKYFSESEFYGYGFLIF